MTPLVSIIMPCYNAEAYIEASIVSVVNQSYQKWELLIVDDNSTDMSSHIIKRFEQQDARIVSLHNHQNLGAAQSRNRALEQAKGRYIAFLDSDDIWFASKLEKQITLMQEQNIALCYSHYEVIDEEGTPLTTYHAPTHVRYRDMLKTSLIGTLTMVYDREILGTPYFQSIGHEDYVFKLALLKKIPYAVGIDEILAQYRRHTQSLSSNKLKTIYWQWKIYREVEKLSLIKSLYYFVHYAYFGVFKYRASPK